MDAGRGETQTMEHFKSSHRLGLLQRRTWLDGRDALSHALHDARRLMTQDAGEQACVQGRRGDQSAVG